MEIRGVIIVGATRVPPRAHGPIDRKGEPRRAACTLVRMTARWSDPHRLPGSPACCDPRYARAASPRDGPMSGVELVLAFLAGVVMGGAFDRFVLPLLVDA